MPIDMLWDGPPDAEATLLLAHGAGGAMDSAGMTEYAEAIAARGIRVARFEFGYMAGRREGVRKPPPRAETLIAEYRAAVAQLAGTALVIGGKSMGGRVASLIADELLDEGAIRGLVCIGYPFHPIGKPEQLRTQHLEALRTPALICQGSRDTFGTREEVADYALSPGIRIDWFDDGDHGLRPRKASGHSYAEHLSTAGAAIAEFVTTVTA